MRFWKPCECGASFFAIFRGDYFNREKLLKQIRSDVFVRADAKMYENKKFLKYI